MKRPLLIGALATSVIALVASAAVAVGALDAPSPGPSMMGSSNGSMMGSSGGTGGSMMGSSGGTGGSMMGSSGGTGGSMMGGSRMGGPVWLAGDGVAVSAIPAARARAASAGRAAGLHPGEVMQFSNGFYVELKDGAGKPAMEVIVDPRTGAVSTEPGPAMMWNTRFPMMGAAGGGAGSVDATKARTIATSWLAANQRGTAIGSIDAYPGYFTLDLRRNGVVSGMMSVRSTTGAAWYHTWHGTFVAMEDS